MKSISVIVPTYNEESNIEGLITRTALTLSSHKINFEIIVIDDHSTDLTIDKIDSLKEKYPVSVTLKQGIKGKAFSLLEGFRLARYSLVAMIDADLQYPPESLPEMIDLINQGDDIIVANRDESLFDPKRKLFSRTFKLVFGQFIHKLDCDVQSGLKVFKKEIINYLDTSHITPWTLDLPLLISARNAGFKLNTVNIKFSDRVNGESKVRLIKTAYEIGRQALIQKLFQKQVYKLKPKQNRMIGAGVIINGRRYITHTTLDHQDSALITFTLPQRIILFSIVLALFSGIFLNLLLTIQIIIAVLSTVYFIDVLFSLYVIFKSLHSPPEFSFSDNQINSINESKLPIYSILCPLYKESRVLPIFLEAISNLDYPKSKLDVQLLLESNDHETIEAAKLLNLPDYVRVTIVPDSQPKTKPKACNYGLNLAKGKYLVIYDAEDIPDPKQLKKAYLAFQKSDEKVVCLQAKLNYFNPHQNILTKLFTSEYSLWFDVMLSGFQSINTAIPLGGTSNHFKTNILHKLQGWDPFNVTEDCDLGIRLFKQGYKTSIIDSVTLEEANSDLKNWIRQRSRWLKGYLQTYLVHNRDIVGFIKEHKWHALIFQLTIGMRITFMIINPILWLTTISYFLLFKYVGATIESLYASPVFYMAVFSLIVGNFFYLYDYMIGCAKRDHWSLIKYVFLIPFYWLAASAAAVIAFHQLFFKPHYWEKTNHGLHLNKDDALAANDVLVEEAITQETKEEIKIPTTQKGLKNFIFNNENKVYLSGALLILANIFANFFNFILNIFLGRTFSTEDFGEISLFTSILFISSIPLSAFSSVITHKSAFLLGKYSKNKAKGYVLHMMRYLIIYSVLTTILWILLIPSLMFFFHSNSLMYFIVFSPVMAIGLINANLSGFLKGTLSFGVIGIMTIVEAVVKLLTAALLIHFGFDDFLIVSIPLSMFCVLLISLFFVLRIKSEPVTNKEASFDRSFFFYSILSNIFGITFFGADIILAKHLLSPFEVGQYSLLSLVGKALYFSSTLFAPFIIPLISKNEGAQKSSRNTFLFLLSGSLFLITFSYIIFGFFGDKTVPILFGDKTLSILSYLPLYLTAVGVFCITQLIIYYFQAKEKYIYSLIGFMTFLLEIVITLLFHSNLEQFIYAMSITSFISLGLVLTYIMFGKRLSEKFNISNQFSDFIFKIPELKTGVLNNQMKILIFNWRDTKHIWSGGAETYIHELAQRWIKNGCHVTIFCGNDQHCPNYEILDGVEIIRRGGFYLTYIWAFFYYTFKFRGKYDVIIDSENGIPFFTPLYAKEKIYLLIHHVHQEVFMSSLKPPLAKLASLLEGKLMPFVYKNITFFTVSESSKKEILNYKLTKKDPFIIYNGVDLNKYTPGDKSKNPTILYLGRLKQYKSIHIIIQSAISILMSFPKVQFIIAGEGDEKNKLIRLAENLGLKEKITFLGKVTEEEKINLYRSAWLFVNPSLMEGWGITTIEANACGTPVVAADVPGLRDSVKNPHTGLLIPYGDVEKFASAIILLIKDKKLRDGMSENAINWAKNYDWQTSADTFYNQVLEDLKKDSHYINDLS